MFIFINTIQISIKETIDFLKNPEQLTTIIGVIFKIIIILLIAKISIKVIESIVNKFFHTQRNSNFKVDVARMETMKGLIKSIVKYLIYFIAFTSIIKSFGVEVGALIATAGIGGLAFGFGAQNLVRDVITGFFILFEEQFSVGNYVEIDGLGGIIEEMALRVTKIRDFNGDLHILPNGEIKKVTNKSTGKMRAWVNMSIAYEEDIDHAMRVLSEVSEKLKEENPSILEGPTVLGVTDLRDSEVVISIIAKTVPMEQWATERIMRKAFKQAFDEHGIEIPYPRRVVINKTS
ncbi:small conductance mechanosensitive channel [Anaerovirgula multivorans]|uniref:Small conductance mechanosensitive channel n=1 Tax=Anaerovirgula multivorans TaxID=312168 RepID=A0A239J659_9FIRM|nr:mechanosensitive ion channel family protein [Anaerovirgula multivorans]SNT00743.1 small conductance mechanosensitive channel [Anaerovirgula multivorans]